MRALVKLVLFFVYCYLTKKISAGLYTTPVSHNTCTLAIFTVCAETSLQFESPSYSLSEGESASICVSIMHDGNLSSGITVEILTDDSQDTNTGLKPTH